jgi:hypothetical protein
MARNPSFFKVGLRPHYLQALARSLYSFKRYKHAESLPALLSAIKMISDRQFYRIFPERTRLSEQNEQLNANSGRRRSRKAGAEQVGKWEPL